MITKKEAFEKMTGVPDAWTNPALMQARNGFIQGWEAALLEAAEWFDYRRGMEVVLKIDTPTELRRMAGVE